MSSAEELIAEAIGAECVTSSFQAECVVLVHMLLSRRPEIPVLFLETGYHFPETLRYRDEIAARWNLNLINVHPAAPVEKLYESDPDRCCAIHKVGPLFAALESYDTWFTGLRREQSKLRAALEPVADFKLPSGKTLRKISPLAGWSTRDVWLYLKEHAIPMLPLYDQGYTSIGCAPCTSRPLDPNDARSGRWAGKKLECGIHIQS